MILDARHVAVLITLALLLQPALADATLAADKEAFVKGELMQLSGTTTLPGSSVTVRATIGSAVVFEKAATAGADGTFAVPVPIQFAYPKGTWTLTATAESKGVKETAEATVEVALSSEAARYLVTFLSPAEGRYQRTESVEIAVSVSTAGAPVNGATARSWSPAGGELALDEVGGGVYSVNVPLGHDAPVGTWTIPVTVTGPADPDDPSQVLLGGDNDLTVSIEKTPLLVAFLDPRVTRFFIEEEVPIRVNVSYTGGHPVELTNVSVTINEAIEVDLTRGDDGTYTGAYVTTTKDEGVLSIAARARDDAGNAGDAATTVTVGGMMQWWLRQYAWFIGALTALALALCLMSSKLRTIVYSRKGLENQYKDILAKHRKLQEDYFEKGIVDRKTFEKKTIEYETGAAKLKGKLAKMEVDAEELVPKEEE